MVKTAATRQPIRRERIRSRSVPGSQSYRNIVKAPMPLNLSNHKAIDAYYAAIATYQTQDGTHEQATRLAFSTLLDAVSKTVGWTLVLEQTLSNRKRPDGTLKTASRSRAATG